MKKLISAYQFVSLDQLPLLRERLLGLARRLGLKGTVLLAPEGINFSLGGDSAATTEWLERLAVDYGVDDPVINCQAVESVPFLRLKVRIRPEIITFDPALDPGVGRTGQGLAPEAWHRLLTEQDVQLVDTRNAYEVAIGSFRGAVNPEIDSFNEFGPWALDHLDPARPVAMFCTGGVRCEKASAWLLTRGFEQVYQLHGGILSYMQHYAGKRSLWEGECFVFDDRVSVDRRMQPSSRPVCAGCRHPHEDLPENGMPPVDEGGRCRLCQRHFEPSRLAGIRERVRQIALARRRGDCHLGPQDRSVTDEASA